MKKWRSHFAYPSLKAPFLFLTHHICHLQRPKLSIKNGSPHKSRQPISIVSTQTSVFLFHEETLFEPEKKSLLMEGTKKTIFSSVMRLYTRKKVSCQYTQKIISKNQLFLGKFYCNLFHLYSLSLRRKQKLIIVYCFWNEWTFSHQNFGLQKKCLKVKKFS